MQMGDFMFYDRFVDLCREKNVSPSRAALDAGISKSLVTKWKTHQTDLPSPDVLNKLSKYFEISVSELLGEKLENMPAESGKNKLTDKEIMFALFGGSERITDAMYEEVKDFAQFVLQREIRKNNN